MMRAKGFARQGFVCVLVATVSLINGRLVAQEQSASQPQTQVTIYIAAMQKTGLPAALTATDLHVSLDKKPVQVVDVKPANSEPLLFALVVDVSKSDETQAAAIRRAALQLFRGLSGKDNKGYLALFNALVGMSQGPVSLDHVEASLDAVKYNGGTALYDAIAQASSQQLGAPANAEVRRRAIVLISDGEDNSSRSPYTSAEEAAQSNGVAVFSLLLPHEHSGPAPIRHVHLQEISRDTGGISVNANAPNSVETLLSAIQNQWAVTLLPARPSDHKLHALQVKPQVKDLEVSAPAQIPCP